MSPIAAPWSGPPVILTQGGSTLTPGSHVRISNLAAAVSIIRPESAAGFELWGDLVAVLKDGTPITVRELGNVSPENLYDALRTAFLYP